MKKFLLTASEIGSCCFAHFGDEPSEKEIELWAEENEKIDSSHLAEKLAALERAHSEGNLARLTEARMAAEDREAETARKLEAAEARIAELEAVLAGCENWFFRYRPIANILVSGGKPRPAVQTIRDALTQFKA